MLGADTWQIIHISRVHIILMSSKKIGADIELSDEVASL